MLLKKIPTYEKIKRRAVTKFLSTIRNTPFQFRAYKAYWNYQFHKSRQKKESLSAHQLHYIGQKPNYGAGIGHQLANWNAGYYFSKFFHLYFAHFPFSNNKWENLLGFGEHETSARTLLNDRSFKKVQLPRFNSESREEVELIGNIIQSYTNDKVFFLLAQDQEYEQQFETCHDLSEKFFTASSRSQDKLFFETGNYNIAVHIRRGDVAAMKQSGGGDWKKRWLNNDYYAHVLQQVLATITPGKNIKVYIFSQGNKEDFPEFEQFSNVHFCLDVNAYDSFVHMIFADLLISSKSSFSYKPVLISKGIKICPEHFWHAYPQTSDFILADDHGTFNHNKLLSNLGL